MDRQPSWKSLMDTGPERYKKQKRQREMISAVFSAPLPGYPPLSPEKHEKSSVISDRASVVAERGGFEPP